MSEFKPSLRLIGAIIGGFFLLFLLLSSGAQVSAGEVGILTTWGKVEPVVLTPGWNFKWPIAQNVIIYDIRVQKEPFKAAAASRDLQDVQAELALNYRPIQGEVFSLHNEVGPDFRSRIVDPAMQEAFKATTAQYTASELITKREEVKVKARDLLAERLRKYHLLVDDLNITNFDFSKDFNAAIEASNVARQNVITLQQNLEQSKVNAQKQVVEAEAAAQARVAQAQGNADAEVSTAKGHATAVVAVAEAEARANTLIANSITPALLNLRQIELVDSKWSGAVPQITFGGASGSSAIPFINLPALAR